MNTLCVLMLLWATATATGVGRDSVCVYPGEHVYRCNDNEDLTEERINALTAEIELAHQIFAEHFFQADVDYCTNFYMEDAIQYRSNRKSFGRKNIRLVFEQAFLRNGPGKVLQETNLNIKIVSERHAYVVMGDWIVVGYDPTRERNILLQDMFKQSDGSWKVLFESRTP